jgi:predicted nucleic acid-binding protein
MRPNQEPYADISSRHYDGRTDDWTQAGRVLARLAAKYDYEQIGQGLTNDALIAMSAGRLGIRVLTANERD